MPLRVRVLSRQHPPENQNATPSFSHFWFRVAVLWPGPVGTLAAAAFGREINVWSLENQAHGKNLDGTWKCSSSIFYTSPSIYIIEHKLGFGKQRDTIDLSNWAFLSAASLSIRTTPCLSILNASLFYYVHVSVSLLSKQCRSDRRSTAAGAKMARCHSDTNTRYTGLTGNHDFPIRIEDH